MESIWLILLDFVQGLQEPPEFHVRYSQARDVDGIFYTDAQIKIKEEEKILLHTFLKCISSTSLHLSVLWL